jgi:D-xylose transport system substrate-binding protein
MGERGFRNRKKRAEVASGSFKAFRNAASSVWPVVVFASLSATVVFGCTPAKTSGSNAGTSRSKANKTVASTSNPLESSGSTDPNSTGNVGGSDASTSRTEQAFDSLAAETIAPSPPGGRIGFILPNSNELRWEAQDRPAIVAACKAAAIECDIENAQGDTAAVPRIAQELIVKGAKVLVIVPTDTAIAVELEQKSESAGIGVVDYDRVLGDRPTLAVLFENADLGRAHGEALVSCAGPGNEGRRFLQLLSNTTSADEFAKAFADATTKAQIETDKDTTVFAAITAADPSGAQVKLAIVDDALSLVRKNVSSAAGIDIAIDGLSQVANSLTGLQAISVGQDTDLEGIRALVYGRRCATVYKNIEIEAEMTVSAAISLIRGEGAPSTKTIKNGIYDTPIVPVPVSTYFRDSIKKVISEGKLSRKLICAQREVDCQSAGI